MLTAAQRTPGRVRALLFWVGAVALIAGLGFLARSIDGATLTATWRALLRSPGSVLGAIAAYASAFALRAVVWRYLLPELTLGHSLAALHVSLGGNHILPLRLGEALRVTSVVRRAGVDVKPAAATTIVTRAADIVAVVGLAALLGPRVTGGIVGTWGWVAAAAAMCLWIGGIVWLHRLKPVRSRSWTSAAVVAASSTLAWVLESAVFWAAAHWAGLGLSFTEAVVVTAVTIAAQTLAIAPGGIGTYEAAATAALVAMGLPAGPALAAAIAAHALKTVYALVTGVVASLWPAPSLVGRVRLPQRVGVPRPSAPPGPDAPIVLFLPAYDEAATVAGVLRRVPDAVRGRPVVRVVIDDGSTDGTAEIAADAGAEVVRLQPNRGLGAAVRAGFEVARKHRAAAVAFCDADGEYAPEELPTLVGPILDGVADYVVGDRFSGDIRRMLPHRRLGNRILTRGLSLAARRKLGDGQSGYRALSHAALAEAEIVHDYNYAQVLTLNLLRKGFRYAEVPISYGFRGEGRSFIRLGTYLKRVIPAAYRELNPPASVLDDVRLESPAGGPPGDLVEATVRS